MPLPDPRFAPQRGDLAFLRRRVRPRAAAPAPESVGVDYVRRSPPAVPPPPAPPPAASPPTKVDYSRHTPRAPLERHVQPLPATPGHVVRVVGDAQRIMGERHPTVTLTRVQSGVGELTMTAVCSPAVGDLRLAALYHLRSGGSGVVAHADGNRFGPSSRRPVVVGFRDEYEQLGVDLRQVTDIERIAVVAYSESRVALDWAGTLIVSTDAGARLEVPLDALPPGSVAVLGTLYNVAGELVVRAELDPVDGDLREAARAYGFDRITWRDDRHPVD